MSACLTSARVVLAVLLAGAPRAQEVWRGTLELGESVTELLGWTEIEGERLVATFHVPEWGMMNLRLAEREDPEGTRLEGSVGRGVLSLFGELGERSYAGRWTSGVDSGAFTLELRPDERPPYRELELTFPISEDPSSEDPSSEGPGAIRLAATVLLPAGEGPWPAVVWAHGSGGIGRRSQVYVREPYRLACAGVASILYDKRGVGESEGDFRTASFHDLARDAVSARCALAAVDGIDAGRIGIGGISQAASWIAPIACDLDSDFAFGLALSATTDTPPVQHGYVVRRRLEAAGFGEDVVARALGLHERIDAWQRTGGDPASLEAELEGLRAEPWFAAALLPTAPLEPYPEAVRAWMWVDPKPFLGALGVPVFACWGSRDDITDPLAGPRVMRELLGAQVELHVYPDGDHSLELGGSAAPGRVVPGLLPDLLTWLDVHGFR